MAQQLVVNAETMAPEEEDDDYRWWPLFSSDSAGMKLGGSAGITDWKSQTTPEDLGEGHAQPEFLHVIEGNGFVQLGDERHDLRKGSAFIIPPNTPHGIWSASDTPLKTYYVALGEE